VAGFNKGGKVSDEHRTRRYETMIVLRTDLQEAGVKEQAERIRKLLETQGAIIGGIHEWGVRELAYAIQKERRGYYVLVEYTAAAAAVVELERNLKLSDFVLRYISIRQDQDAPSVASPQPDSDTPSDPSDSRIFPEEGDLVSADAEASDVE
jgi:small subunit ribosomal protein S6